MLANRISFTLGLTGPSFLLDTACSSSMYALDCAFNAIRSGECDAALVGGSNLLLHPYVTLQFARFVSNNVKNHETYKKSISLTTDLEFSHLMAIVDLLTKMQRVTLVPKQFASSIFKKLRTQNAFTPIYFTPKPIVMVIKKRASLIHQARCK